MLSFTARYIKSYTLFTSSLNVGSVSKKRNLSRVKENNTRKRMKKAKSQKKIFRKSFCTRLIPFFRRQGAKLTLLSRLWPGILVRLKSQTNVTTLYVVEPNFFTGPAKKFLNFLPWRQCLFRLCPPFNDFSTEKGT